MINGTFTRSSRTAALWVPLCLAMYIAIGIPMMMSAMTATPATRNDVPIELIRTP